MEVFVEQTPVCQTDMTDRARGQGWLKSHKQETPTLLTDADKSTNIKRRKNIFLGGPKIILKGENFWVVGNGLEQQVIWRGGDKALKKSGNAVLLQN